MISISVGTGGLGATYRAAAKAEQVLDATEKPVVFLDENDYQANQNEALVLGHKTGHLAEGHVIDLLREHSKRCTSVRVVNTTDKAEYALSSDERISLADMHWANAIQKGQIKEGSFVIIDCILVSSNLEWIIDKLEKIKKMGLSVFLVVPSIDTNSDSFKSIEKHVSTITYSNIQPIDAHSKACLEYVKRNQIDTRIKKGIGANVVTIDLQSYEITKEFIPYRSIRSIGPEALNI